MHKVAVAPQAARAHKVYKDPRVHKVHKVAPRDLVLLAPKVHKVLLDLMGMLVLVLLASMLWELTQP